MGGWCGDLKSKGDIIGLPPHQYALCAGMQDAGLVTNGWRRVLRWGTGIQQS